MQRAFWRLSKVLFFLALALALTGVAARELVPSAFLAEDGCHWTSGLFAYIDCPDVPAGWLIAFLLNLPFWVFAYVHDIAFKLIASGMILDGQIRQIFWVLVSLACVLMLAMGGLFPLRWIYDKLGSRVQRQSDARRAGDDRSTRD